MVEFVLASGSDQVFDPAVGPGAFLAAAKRTSASRGTKIALLGTELDPAALAQAGANGLAPEDLRGVCIADFLSAKLAGPYGAIVANPPYVRHHRLAAEVKQQLKAIALRVLGTTLDGRAGLHVYFLLRALEVLRAGGRLAFILPADTFEGVFAPRLWSAIGRRYRIAATVTFSPSASPFPDMDTNPVIVFIENLRASQTLYWVECQVSGTAGLAEWVAAGLGLARHPDLLIGVRSLEEALATGLSRPPRKTPPPMGKLGDFASVMRGIATGANAFFFLTSTQCARMGIAGEFLTRTIVRTRDVPGPVVDARLLEELEGAGRPTYLLSIDGRPLDALPAALQKYLRAGEAAGLHLRPLVASRRPWYKMERRQAPPFLFAYLGRRKARFIQNQAGVIPSNNFICVYPRDGGEAHQQALWLLLQDPRVAANLRLVGKSYGRGAIKVEPRALEALPLPEEALQHAGLRPARGNQQRRFDFAQAVG
jgi:hypothetical protein